MGRIAHVCTLGTFVSFSLF